jgi:hypothetical protein
MVQKNGSTNPNETVANEIKDTYKLVFVDEFQDSNPVQLKIFDKLSELVEKSIWVGDPKQAIYGFRGSDAQLIMGEVSVLLVSVAVAARSAKTCAVVASCVVFVLTAAVGAVGTPVSAGLARFALRFKAVCCAVETGLPASLVLSTLLKPTSVFSSVTAPVLPATEVTVLT